MHIFLDESGAFVPLAAPKPKAAAVGALIVPDSELPGVVAEFERLRRQFGGEGELKGSRLTERQVAGVIQMLRAHDVIFEASVIDIGRESVSNVERAREIQAEKLLEHLTREHQPSLIQEVLALREQMLQTPLQLFVQMELTWNVVIRAVETSTLYYVQRRPSELGLFTWRVDAKNKGSIVPYERLWSTLVKPMMATRSLERPMIMLDGADYSYFKRYERPSDMKPGHVGNDVKEILRDLHFVASEQDPGVQLADILVSALTRACNRTLQSDGWRELGRLMIRNNPLAIQLVAFHDGYASDAVASVVQQLHQRSRWMLNPDWSPVPRPSDQSLGGAPNESEA